MGYVEDLIYKVKKTIDNKNVSESVIEIDIDEIPCNNDIPSY